MRAELIQIGNSKGIRIPKAVIQQCGLEKGVELEVREGELIIRPTRFPRAGWREAAREMAACGGEARLLDEASTAFDLDEWQW